MKKLLGKINELIFVIYRREGGGFTAIEGNFGLVAMGDDELSLKSAVRCQVIEFFKGDFSGTVRLRSFTDTVLTIQPDESQP
ncbi:hypothetical protein JHJ32_10920 [Parapedobacter sp. ISTM3]|uniref:Uncharacterized protein n=1 Tax=Parapedobacter luteus TaxID=623280 RepID=A0A1T5B429_9SPHI|nr:MULTISPECIES: hypothetical protein [Parapedobacter]MBK1440499.1 hypothetical protein [Parapedobacter sp. ISTM3]SKB41869.1 hypothetical protein SAMN05660226_01324 [Parapedobacter luteus]